MAEKQLSRHSYHQLADTWIQLWITLTELMTPGLFNALRHSTMRLQMAFEQFDSAKRSAENRLPLSSYLRRMISSTNSASLAQDSTDVPTCSICQLALGEVEDESDLDEAELSLTGASNILSWNDEVNCNSSLWNDLPLENNEDANPVTTEAGTAMNDVEEAKTTDESQLAVPPPNDWQAIMLRLDCEHVFHLRCVREWLHMNPSCPNCRQVVTPSTDLTGISSSVEKE